MGTPYDIASKILVKGDPKNFVSLLLSRSVDECEEIEELPQEMPIISRADQVLKVRYDKEEPIIVLTEFLTHWDRKKKLDLAIYDLWLTRKYELNVTPLLILTLPNQHADNVYKDLNCTFTFQLIKLWEYDAAELLQRKQLTLYPLAPLMKGGLALVEQVETEIFTSSLPRSEKGDLLAVLGLFLGLTDKNKAASLVSKRSAFMSLVAESPFYRWIKDEGLREGLIGSVKLGLELQFGAEAFPLFENLEKIEDQARLRRLETALREKQPLAYFSQELQTS